MAYSTIQNNNLICGLCPHNCNIPEGSSGICSVRRNNKMHLELPYNGILSAISTDPIEKKPLYHFEPGSNILSIGFYGCNFHCQFCQNYQISQEFDANVNINFISPLHIVQLAEKKELLLVRITTLEKQESKLKEKSKEYQEIIMEKTK